MSAVALVPQDKAGLSGLVARKASAGGAQDDDPDADFSAALAQTADTGPAPATQAATPRVKGGDDIWRTLSTFSDEAKTPQTVSLGDATEVAVATPALKPAPPATEISDRHDDRVPAKPDAAADWAAATVTTRGSDAAPLRPSRAASLNAPPPSASLSSISLEPERISRAPDKTAAKALSEIDRATPQAEATVSTAWPSNPPVACADPGLASALPLPLLQKSDSAATGPATDQDAVARIGAALAPRGAQGAGGTQKPAACDPGLKMAMLSEEASEGTTTSVHVITQQTWLQPVSPVFSPGLRRQAAADRAALETPQVAGGKSEVQAGGKTESTARGKIEVDGKDAPAAATKSAAPSADPALEKAPQAPSSIPCSPGGGSLVSDRSEAAKPAAAAPPSDEPRPGLAATPRKNLEITLAPRELGGLEVRMKSAGDRLELAFVADRGETARLISDKSAALTSQLQDAGIGLGGIDINSAASGQGASGEAPTGGGRPPNPSGGDNPAPQREQTSGRDRQDRNNETNDQTGDASSRGQRGLYL